MWFRKTVAPYENNILRKGICININNNFIIFFFLGLILEPNKRYTQTVEKSFHVSMASLNLQKAGNINKFVLC